MILRRLPAILREQVPVRCSSLLIMVALTVGYRVGDQHSAPVHNLMHSREHSVAHGHHAHDILLTATTVNVWERTATFLTSLANCRDRFDILIVDECSTDGTREKLQELDINTVFVNETMGVTHNWNVAYEYFLSKGYQYLVYSNNDVLVPDGVTTELARAMTEHNCALITPLSTLKGKGHRGPSEGIEVVYSLNDAETSFVNNPANYARVQGILDEAYDFAEAKVLQTNAENDPENLHRKDFNGFFFVVSRNISVAEFSPGVLFDPGNRIVGQELDLARRIYKTGGKLCLHTGTFVYHYKSSTIPDMRKASGVDDRESFRISVPS